MRSALRQSTIRSVYSLLRSGDCSRRLGSLCDVPDYYNVAVPTNWSCTREYSKGPKKNRKQAQSAEIGETIFELDEYREMMIKSIDHFQHELANIRMGRATPGMLDHLKVDAYGEKLPMKAVGTVSVKSPQLLAVTVFDSGLVDSVASCIASSPLELNPRVEGQEILVPIPSPTHETLEAMKKLCKGEAENAKVSIRQARKQAMGACGKEIACKDTKFSVEKQIQNMTDEFVVQVENLLKRKQGDIDCHNS